MSAQSYVADTKKSYEDIVHAIRNREGEIKRRNEQIAKLTRRSGKTDWNEVGKRQYLGNEVEELKRQNAKDAGKIKDLKKDLDKAKGLYEEAVLIARDPSRFKSRAQAMVKDTNDRIALLAADIKKIDKRVKELDADYNRAGTLDIGAKGYIRDRQKDLKQKRDKAVKAQQDLADRRKKFESKVALVDKVTGSNLAGWGVAALGGLFVAANL
jgi:chromosome segregation ATPase